MTKLVKRGDNVNKDIFESVWAVLAKYPNMPRYEMADFLMGRGLVNHISPSTVGNIAKFCTFEEYAAWVEKRRLERRAAEERKKAAAVNPVQTEMEPAVSFHIFEAPEVKVAVGDTMITQMEKNIAALAEKILDENNTLLAQIRDSLRSVEHYTMALLQVLAANGGGEK